MTSSKSKQAAEEFSRSHDYPWLVKRWKSAARKAGLGFSSFAQSGGFEIYWARSISASPGSLRLYLSAGIHGDESASTEAVLSWVSGNQHLLPSLDLTIFPCLNPWGLTHNKRTDDQGIDLNRCYKNPHTTPHIAAQCALIAAKHFDLAIILHEDYDARGVYVYETSATRPHLGEKIITAMERHLPHDPRSRIDGSRSRHGVIRRRVSPDTLPEWPEALLLHFGHADRTFTIETPSECSIHNRVASHCDGIDAAVTECKRHLCYRPHRA